MEEKSYECERGKSDCCFRSTEERNMSIREKVLRQKEEISKTLYGMDDIIKIYILSKTCDLTILLLGAHATAKSSLARMWSITTGLNYRVVTSSEVDESLIAYIDPAIFREKNIVQMRRGELMEKNHIIIDEYFLWLNKYRAKLHQLLEEKTYAGLDSLVFTYTFLSNPLSDYYAGQIEEKNLACYSEDTEILTSEGWKTYSEIKEDEKVFTLNPKTQEIQIEQIKRKVVYPYSGKMYLLDSQQINQLVTPNHRMYIARQEQGKWRWQVKEAKEIYGSKFRLLKTGNWTGTAKVSRDYMALIGWFLAEGSLKTFHNGHYGIDLAVCVPKYIDEVMNLSRRLGYNPHLQKDGHIVIWSKDLWRVCKPLGHANEKYVPEKLKEESRENLKSLLLAYLKGDGWNQDGQWLAKTVSKRLADDLQEVALKCGYAINLVNLGKTEGYSPKLKRTIKSRSDCWLMSFITKRCRPLFLGKENKNRRRTIEKWEDYNGLVWCVSTNNGILYVRRNGKACWSGNTIDRIDLFVPVNQPKIVPSETMMRKFSKFGRKEKPLSQVITWEEYMKAKEEIAQVTIPSRVIIWLTLFAHAMASCKHVQDKWSVSTAKMKKLCAACNENAHLCGKVCLSKPRFLRATIILAKGLAWLGGRSIVSFQDVNEAIHYTLPHRITWIQEELSYAESLELIPELSTQFNDEMLAWKNRGVFSELAKIIESSKKTPPVFEEKIGQSLSADVSEIHLLKEFVTETLASVEEDIGKFYVTEGVRSDFDSLTDLKSFLEQSGLGAFDKEELTFAIATQSKKLFFSLPNTAENIENLVSCLIALHKKEGASIDDEMLLTRKFTENVAFDSELMKIKESLGEIQLLFEDEELRAAFLKLWSRV